MKTLLTFLLFLFSAASLTAQGPGLTQGQITASAVSAACQPNAAPPNPGCVILQPGPSASGTIIGITGTFTATLQFEVSPDGGTTWSAIDATPFQTGAVQAAVSTTAAPGTWITSVSGFSFFRVRASAYTSGTALVSLSPGPGLTMVVGPNGASLNIATNGALNVTPVSTDPCASSAVAKLSAFANIATATTTSLVAVNGAKAVYVCGISINFSTASATLLFEQGTGATCAGTPTAISATYTDGTLAAMEVDHAGGGTMFTAAASNGLCVVSGGTTPTIGVTVTYVQQ